MSRLIIGFQDTKDLQFAKYLQRQNGRLASVSEFWNDFNQGYNGGMTSAVAKLRKEYGGDSIASHTLFVAVCAESGASRL